MKMHWKMSSATCRSFFSRGDALTHWGRATHICISDVTSIGSDDGLSPGRRQAIIWTNAGMLLIGPLGTNFSEISIKILAFSFAKIRLKVSSAKRRPFCLGLNVLKRTWFQRIQLNMSFTWRISQKCWKKHIWHIHDMIFYQIMTDAFLLRYHVEQEVDRPVIWNVMTLMWRHCNYKGFRFQKMCGCLFCSQSWHAVEQIVKRAVIWDAMAIIWSPCNDNAAKCDFGITNDHVFTEGVLIFPVL